MEIIICGQDHQECDWIVNYIYDYYQEKYIDIQIITCDDWSELYHLIQKKKTDILIITQEGVKGLDIITGLNIPEGKIIWFSDLDFSIQAYRLGVTYFNKKPVSSEKLEQALEYISS